MNPQQANGGAFRGFSREDLAAFGQQQAPQQAQQQAQSPSAHNWRYADRSTKAMAPYSQFTNYQTDYESNRYKSTKSPAEEMDMLLAMKEEERQRQLTMFEQRWQAQLSGSSSTGNDHIIREGIWARTPQTSTKAIPYPIHAQPWKGENEFLDNLEVVEAFLASQKIFFKDGLTCMVEGCGAVLQNAEFVDQINKVAWPVSFIHYLGDHHNPPSKFFYDYIRRAAGAIRAMSQQPQQ